MLPSDEADLEFYFTKCGKYQPSLFGPMLERAAIMRTDSEGKPIPAPQINYLWRPGGEDQAMRPSMAAHKEPSYTPDVEDFHRFGCVSRRLNRVGRKDPLLRAALTAYYGDSGGRWREMAIPAKDDDGNSVRPGYGPGQIVSLYALTKSGQALLEKATAKKGEHRTVDEHLEVALIAIASKPKSQAKAILDAIRLEADALLLKARSAYLGACVAEDPKRYQKKPMARQVRSRAVRWPARMEEAV
jgi:hypothetical protein